MLVREVISNYRQGYSLRQIGVMGKMSPGMVKAILTKNNVKLRRVGGINKVTTKQIIQFCKAHPGISRKGVLDFFEISNGYLSKLVAHTRNSSVPKRRKIKC